MDFKKNVGYIIVNEFTVGETRIVLGVHENLPNRFVTWECKDDDYFWGHYFSDILAAEKDFLMRGLEKVKFYEQINKERKREPER